MPIGAEKLRILTFHRSPTVQDGGSDYQSDYQYSMNNNSQQGPGKTNLKKKILIYLYAN